MDDTEYILRKVSGMHQGTVRALTVLKREGGQAELNETAIAGLEARAAALSQVSALINSVMNGNRDALH